MDEKRIKYMAMLHRIVMWIEKNVVAKREPDVYIGGKEATYVRRWHLIPRNPLFNIYYHHFLRSDFAEALHDHPWLWNASWLVEGSYTEHTFNAPVDRKNRVKFYQRALPKRWLPEIGTIQARPAIEILRPLPPTGRLDVNEGRFKWRWGASPHRIELHKDYRDEEQPVKTIFITGPKIPYISKWGFYCKRGWKH
jgi:hypothetical protein